MTNATSNASRRFFRNAAFFVVAISSLFVVVISVLTLFGASCRPLELLTHLRVQLVVALIALVPVLLFLKSRIVLGFVVLALCIHLFDIVPLYCQRPGGASAATIRVLTLNVNTWNEKFADVQKLIDDEDADIVCLQELAPKMANSLQSSLPGYPYRFVEARDGNFGIGIYSKYELKNQEKLKLCPDNILTLCATINAQGTEIRVINTHPIAPLNDLFYGWRNVQLDALADLTAREKHPVILGR